jgi:hypothetical protein
MGCVYIQYAVHIVYIWCFEQFLNIMGCVYIQYTVHIVYIWCFEQFLNIMGCVYIGACIIIYVHKEYCL